MSENHNLTPSKRAMVLELVTPAAPRNPHVLLFPFPEQGHINPLLDIAFRLSASGILSTFVMPAHLDTHHGESAPEENLRFAALDLPPETTHKLLACIGSWKATSEILATHFLGPLRSFILSSAKASSGYHDLLPPPPISCLISDTFMPWTVDLASDLGIPHVEMWTGSASTYVFGSSILQLISMGILPFKQGPLSLSLSLSLSLHIHFIPSSIHTYSILILLHQGHTISRWTLCPASRHLDWAISLSTPSQMRILQTQSSKP